MMIYTTLLVHLEPGLLNTDLLKSAGDLPDCFHTDLLEIAPFPTAGITCGEGYVFWHLIRQQRSLIGEDTKLMKRKFRHMLRTHATTFEWRSEVMCTSIFDYLARQARSADLVITSTASSALSAARVNDPSAQWGLFQNLILKRNLAALSDSAYSI